MSRGQSVSANKVNQFITLTVNYFPRSGVCKVKLRKRISMGMHGEKNTVLIAQKFPSFDQVSLRNGSVLTCDGHNDGFGGILAFGAKSLLIDETSKIDMSGKGTSQVS